jgi:hypothetical protein
VTVGNADVAYRRVTRCEENSKITGKSRRLGARPARTESRLLRQPGGFEGLSLVKVRVVPGRAIDAPGAISLGGLNLNPRSPGRCAGERAGQGTLGVT